MYVRGVGVGVGGGIRHLVGTISDRVVVLVRVVERHGALGQQLDLHE